MSMSLVLSFIARFMTRGLYALLNTGHSWCHLLKLSPEAVLELQFWLFNLERYNGQSIWHSPSAVRLGYSDASDSGYEGYVIEHGPQIAHGQWSPEEAARSSTWRELCGVQRVLESIACSLKNERLRWFTDNANIVQILTVGSKKPHLQTLALSIFSVCMANQIRLEPEWLPREENVQADLINRIVDYDDWRLDPVVFADDGPAYH